MDLCKAFDTIVDSGPRIEKNRANLYWPQTHDIGIKMKQKELTKTFMISLN